VEPWAILAVVVVLVALAAVYRGRQARRDLEAVRRQVGIGPSGGVAAGAARLTGELDEVRRNLRQEQVERDTLLGLLEQGVVAVDAGGRIARANPAAHVLLARAPGSLVGRTLMEAFLDVDVETLVRDIGESGTAVGELRPAGPDGPALVVRVRREAADGTWLVLEDVSELRRLQRIRTEFIDNLSHELRTPLTTVGLLAETLSREADVAGDAIPPKMRERIAKIEVETGHIVQMVNELLDLSRIEGGGTLLLADGLDMGAIAAASAERLRLFAERQGVDLRIETQPGLPPVRGDGARLGQVVVNLVHNAVKFSPDGGDVIVRTVAEGDSVVTSIEDHGVGIPKAAQDRVFERFYKVDRARRRGEAGGTGLGLAIARHVVEQHGGRIWVQSTDGAGSTFSFALPIVAGGAA
jgi:two-component system phosphate regulon sensor histidine kinase PhoR